MNEFAVLTDAPFVVSIAFDDAGGANSEWFKTALNILAGGVSAILGGYAGSYLNEKFAKNRRREDKLLIEKASAFALQVQLMGMYSDLAQFREHLGQSRVAIRGHRGNDFRGQFHQGFAGEQTYVHFRIEDLQALGSYGSESLLNLVSDLDRRFNGIAAALNIYRATWLELSREMSGEVVGSVVQMSLSIDEVRRLTPKLAMQSKILDDLDPMVEEMLHDTYKALIGTYQARVRAHGLRKPFEGISPDGQYVIVQPDPKAPPPEPKPLSQK